jgi:hypothetical protein
MLDAYKSDDFKKWTTLFYMEATEPTKKGDPETRIPLNMSAFPYIAGVGMFKVPKREYRVYVDYMDGKQWMAYAGKDKREAARITWYRSLEAYIGGPATPQLWNNFSQERKTAIRGTDSEIGYKIAAAVGISTKDMAITNHRGLVSGLTGPLDMYNYIRWMYHCKYG